MAQRIPRVARAHWDDTTKKFRVVLTAVDKGTNEFDVRKVIEFLGTLAEVLALIAQIWGAPPTGVDPLTDMVGEMGDTVVSLMTMFEVSGKTGGGASPAPGDTITIPGKGVWTWSSV